jgi:peptidoglycan/xylan/chitin deacetylase (PgdA/CDA1 family)
VSIVRDDVFRVALTFDTEHPDRSWCPPGTTDLILDVLETDQVRASFFLQGRWAESQPASAKRIAAAGHLVGHHSHYHTRMSLLHDDGIAADLEDGRRAIVEHAGVDPRPWFRCPFGDGHDDSRVLEAISRLGYRNVHWHVELQDWEPWRTGASIAEDAVAGVRAHGDGAVVLLHGWPGGTGEAVGPIVTALRRVGTTFVTVDELEELPA